ncbi:MAG: DUF6569 family protein [Gemmatimonadota bacterium]|nr:DUF6569 family protein [Gemmatimonadota bacterium]
MTHTPTLALAPVAPQMHGAITVFPLVSLEPVELPYALPEEAIEAGTLTIGEVSEAGSVPQLGAVNTGDTDILVLDGTQLIGAKQNRMASRSFILPAESETVIPVSCIEQGRWRFNERRFRGAPQHSPSRARRSVRHVEAALAERGARASADRLGAAQGQVWREVDLYQKKHAMRSPTAALTDVFDGVRERIDAWVGAFPVVEGQVGVLIFRDGEPLGVDVIGGRDLYRRLHERLLRGYALDALEHDGDNARKRPGSREGVDARTARKLETGSPVDEFDALVFLADVTAAKRTEAPTVGKGRYWVLSGGVVGAELVDGERLAHRNAFTG